MYFACWICLDRMALPHLTTIQPTNDASTQHVILGIKIQPCVSVFALKLTDFMPVKSNLTKTRVYVSTDLFNNTCNCLSRKGMGKIKYDIYSFTKTQKGSISEVGVIIWLLTSRLRYMFAVEFVFLQLIKIYLVGEQNVSAQLLFTCNFMIYIHVNQLGKFPSTGLWPKDFRPVGGVIFGTRRKLITVHYLCKILNQKYRRSIITVLFTRFCLLCLITEPYWGYRCLGCILCEFGTQVWSSQNCRKLRYWLVGVKSVKYRSKRLLKSDEICSNVLDTNMSP
jgi:hypothetical protein